MSAITIKCQTHCPLDGLSYRANVCLLNAGLDTPEKIYAAGRHAIRLIPNIGEVTATKIEEWLNAQGFYWPPPEGQSKTEKAEYTELCMNLENAWLALEAKRFSAESMRAMEHLCASGRCDPIGKVIQVNGNYLRMTKLGLRTISANEYKHWVGLFVETGQWGCPLSSGAADVYQTA